MVDRKNSLGLDGIKEVRESLENLLETNDDKNDSGLSGCGRCDSGGVSRGNSSVGQAIGEVHGIYKKRLERTCSCFYGETCALCGGGGGSSSSSNADNQQYSVIEESCDGFTKR